MKTLAKIKKRPTNVSKFDQWLYKFELPDWVKRRVIAPILVISIFMLGANFQISNTVFTH